jgi:hypothetical protein
MPLVKRVSVCQNGGGWVWSGAFNCLYCLQPRNTVVVAHSDAEALAELERKSEKPCVQCHTAGRKVKPRDCFEPLLKAYKVL